MITETTHPGPLAILGALNSRHLRCAPRSLAHQLTAGQLAKAAALKTRALTQARDLEHDVETGNHLLNAALTDEKTPGIVDQAEAATIARHYVETATRAGTHTQTLEEL